jgi:hypothetical protein
MILLCFGDRKSMVESLAVDDGRMAHALVLAGDAIVKRVTLRLDHERAVTSVYRWLENPDRTSILRNLCSLIVKDLMSAAVISRKVVWTF